MGLELPTTNEKGLGGISVRGRQKMCVKTQNRG